MKIKLIKNIEFKDDTFVCNQIDGICISEFELHFENDIELLDKDHCECINSFIIADGNKLKIRLVTDKNEIDEYLIFNLKNKNLKIRFKR